MIWDFFEPRDHWFLSLDETGVYLGFLIVFFFDFFDFFHLLSSSEDKEDEEDDDDELEDEELSEDSSGLRFTGAFFIAFAAFCLPSVI